MIPLGTYASVALVAAALAGAGTWKTMAWRHAAQDAARIEAQAEKARNDRKAAQVASEGFEDDRTKTEIKYRTITKEVARIVERPVYRNTCFDESGLQLIRAAIGTAGDTGEPADPLPESR